MANPKFDRALSLMAAMHANKAADYAMAENPYSNFETAAAGAGVTVDQAFAVLVGVKLARLRELGLTRQPKNESAQDSRLDLAVYAALWMSYHL